MSFSKKLFAILGVFILAVALYGTYIFIQSTETWEATFSETDNQHAIPEKTGADFVSVLFLGLDENDLREGRSDFIMFTLLNLETGKITAISIPRDSRIEITPDKPEKLNHAYTYSPETAMNTVEQILNFPIDYYMALNLNAFKDFIDIIGGIEIDAEKRIEFNDDIVIDKGKQQMDGKTALSYVRFRQDNEGDFGRMRRQQQVLDAIMDQVINIKTVSNINDFFELAEQNIRHNIPLDSLLSNAPGLTNISVDKFKRERLTGDNTQIDSLWYVELDSTKLEQVRHDIRTEHSSTK